MKNEQVINEWSKGREAHSHNHNLSTDGRSLYSYVKLIGITADCGSKIVLDYTAPAGHFNSVTTSTHVGRAKEVADQVMNPTAAKLGGLLQLEIPF